MKTILLLLTFFTFKANGQSDLRCSHLTGDIYQLDWFGVPGRSYFIQASSDNMVTWDYLPDIRFGQGVNLSMGFEKVIEGMYLRLVYTDFPTDNPDIADFSGDGLTNIEKVMMGLSPFEYTEGGGATTGGGTGNGESQEGAPLPSFELKVEVIVDGASATTRTRLDAGFNVLSENGIAQDGGVPSISVSRSNNVSTRITLTDLTGLNVGATLNFLKLQTDSTVPLLEPFISMVGGVSLAIPLEAIPENPLDPPVGPEVVPRFITFPITGDLDPAEAGSLDHWLLKPMDVSVAFGTGPLVDDLDNPLNSRKFLLDQLELRKSLDPNNAFNSGQIWGLRGVALREEGDENTEEQIYAIEICRRHQDPLLRALQSKERTVIFDGHSNFGIGPNFVVEPIKRISDFTNFGVRYTDIPRTYRLNHPGMEPPAAENNDPPLNPDAPPPAVESLDDSESAVHMRDEGWGHLDLAEADVRGDDSVNYVPVPLLTRNNIPIGNVVANGFLRFPNNQNPPVGRDQNFTLQGAGFSSWHYIRNGSTRLIVDLPEQGEDEFDVPENMAYRTFFFNACNSGLDYIENFTRDEFVYTTRTCAVVRATTLYVFQFVDGQNTQDIVNFLNEQNAGGNENGSLDEQDDIVYVLEN